MKSAAACRKCHRAAKYGSLCGPHFNAVGVHGYVDPGPARERIAALRDSGWSWRELEHRTGVSRQTLMCRNARVQKTTVQAILAVPVTKAPLQGAKLTPAVGPRRRVQALMMMGWTQTAIAHHAALPLHTVNRLALEYSDHTTAATAAAIADVFTALAMTPGPSRRARTHAQKRGWVPPLAWDDNIDDPTATPDLGAERRVPFEERYRELTDHVGIRSEERIAEMLGIQPASVRKQCNHNNLARAS